MSDKPQTIIKLTGENVMRLTAVSCEPNGAPIIEVTGKNEVGKTTVLRMLEMAFGGKKCVPDEPITKGKAKGYIVAETQEYVIKRKFTQSGTSLTVEPKNGSKIDRPPQELLDSIVGSLSFDPFSFTNKKPADQVEMFRNALHLDFTDLDNERTEAYNKRKTLNQQALSAKAQHNALPQFDDAPPEKISVAALMEELKKRQAVIEQNKNAQAIIEKLQDAVKDREDSLQQAMDAHGEKIAELARVKEELAECEKSISYWEVEKERSESRLSIAEKEALALVDPDTDEIEVKIEGAEKENLKLLANETKAKKKIELDELETFSHAFTSRIQEIDKEKTSLIASSNLPIDGLAMDENGVTFKDIPFGQLSKAQQIRISCAVGLALNPSLRVMLIRDGSLLDDDNLQILHDMAVQNSAQIWIERVSNDKQVKIVIVDDVANKE